MSSAGRTELAMGLALLAAPLLVGCPADDGRDPLDAPIGAVGLDVAWRTAAPIPGPAGATLRVDELHLTLSSVRAIGDAAPGDPRTSVGRLELEWNDGGPPPLRFDAAPAGLYGRVELGIGGDPEAFELHGAVRLNDAWTPLEVEDETGLAITVPTSLTLAPGARATVTITLDVAATLAPVDFTQVPLVSGTLRLTAADPQIGAVRAALRDAFSADPGGAPAVR